MDDGGGGEEDGEYCCWIRTNGDTMPISLDEELEEALGDAVSKFPDEYPKVIRFEFGGDVFYGELLVFDCVLD